MRSRLAYALALSVSLHAVLLFAGAVDSAAPPAPAPLEVRLRLPPAPPAEALLKDTLASEDATKEKTPASKPPPPAPTPPSSLATQQPAPADSARMKSQASPTPVRELRAAQKKLAQHQYYPPAAIAAGIEGEVRLLITLAADGSVADVDVAAGSGHAILDQAAVRAAWAMGSLPGLGRRELLLPVVFSLR